VEDLLYREAALLDDWDLDGWLRLWAAGPTRYVVPCNDTPDGDPAQDLVLIDDDELRMRLRGGRLNSRKAHREYRTPGPTPDLQRDAGTGARRRLPVTASFTVWRFRGGKASSYVGRHYYRLVASRRRTADPGQARGAGHDRAAPGG